jgi:putative phosphoribosyl transferase
MLPFLDRLHAGRHLASKLKGYRGDPDVVVVGLPRGGVPVAFEIAQHLRAPLDILVVKKLGVPWREELAMGAVASGGVQILDHALIRSLNLSNYYVYGLIARVEKEIQRQEALFRNGHPAKVLSSRTVILVDDGAATGSTMLAAAEAVRSQHPKQIVIAVPVASRDAYMTFETQVGKCVCLATPEPFCSVGQWYESFAQVTDAEVKDLSAQSRLGEAETESLVQSSAASS